MIWEFISDLLKNPEMIRAGMNALIEREQAAKSREAGEEAAVWVKKLEECARLKSAYQDQQAAGFMTLEELEGTHKLAQAELVVLEMREKRVKELKKDRDALLESWAGILPEALEGLTVEERNKIYRMLRLEVTPTPEGYGVTGALGGVLYSRIDAVPVGRRERLGVRGLPSAGIGRWCRLRRLSHGRVVRRSRHCKMRVGADIVPTLW
jgi:hypothetical protein